MERRIKSYEIADFYSQGLWSFESILFSRYGLLGQDFEQDRVRKSGDSRYCFLVKLMLLKGSAFS